MLRSKKFALFSVNVSQGHTKNASDDTIPIAMMKPSNGMTNRLAKMLTGVNRWKYNAIRGNNPSQAANDALTSRVSQITAGSTKRRQDGMKSRGTKGSAASDVRNRASNRGDNTSKPKTAMKDKTNPPSKSCRGFQIKSASAAAANVFSESAGRTSIHAIKHAHAITNARTAPGRAPVANTYKISNGTAANPHQRRGIRTKRSAINTTAVTNPTCRPEMAKT